MDSEQTTFQARCLCGQSITISPNQIGSHLICPACSRTLIPVTAQSTQAILPAPAPSEAVIASPAKNAAAPAVFNLSVSQWDNFWRYLTCAVFLIIASGVYLVPQFSEYANMIFGAVLLVALASAYFIFSSARSTRYLINADRIETRSGLFTKEINWISLNSVLDIQLKQSFIQRMLGIGVIRIKSTDHDTPLMVLNQIPQALKVFEFLQRRVSYLPHGYTEPIQGRA